jgi:hypothetical protein
MASVEIPFRAILYSSWPVAWRADSPTTNRRLRISGAAKLAGQYRVMTSQVALDYAVLVRTIDQVAAPTQRRGFLRVRYLD